MKVFFEEKHDYSGLKNIIGDTIERNILLRLKNGDRVLLKPNLLTDKPLAISKHEMIKAVAEVFIEMGAHVDIADSPGNADSIDGIIKVAGLDSIPAGYYFFDDENEKKYINGFPLAKRIEDYDVIVNLPRLKTHILTVMTMGVKNLYGFIPGRPKKSYHVSHPDPYSFSSMLLSLYRSVKTHLTILDGIIGMQGNGPNNGDPIETGFIAISRDPLALDIAVADYLNVKNFPLRDLSIEQGFRYPEIIGELPPPPAIDIPSGPLLRLPHIGRLRRVVFPRKPRYNRNNCTGCRACVLNCPTGAISMVYGNIIINYSRCIECYTCIEVCNFDALEVYKLNLKRRFV